MEPVVLIQYLLLGAVAGTLAGLLGVGGGLVIVPVLAFIFTYSDIGLPVLMQLAVGTSLATIVATSISSVRAHHQHGAVQWKIFLQLAPGIVVGALIGSLVADSLPTDTLRIIFAVFEIGVAIQMLLAIMPDAHRSLPRNVVMMLVGMVIGAVSAIVGIGGGTLTVPFLVYCGVNIRKAIATSAACGLPIAVAGTTGFVIAGWQEPGLPQWSFGYVYLPAFISIIISSMLFAPLGARLAHTLPIPMLKKIFAMLLVIIGTRLLFDL
jgi:uncharacterized membrane protein YfcA